MTISPVAAIPHKSKAYQTRLDFLSYRLRLKNGGVVKSVNDTTEKVAPQGSIDQIGESLSRIIYAFAETDDDAKGRSWRLQSQYDKGSTEEELKCSAAQSLAQLLPSARRSQWPRASTQQR